MEGEWKGLELERERKRRNGRRGGRMEFRGDFGRG